MRSSACAIVPSALTQTTSLLGVKKDAMSMGSGCMHERGTQPVHVAQVGKARVNDVGVSLVQPGERATVVEKEYEMRRRQRADCSRGIDLHAAKALGFQ